MPKDHFSRQSEAYARYRPGYPETLYRHLLQLVPGAGAAWDCATGNGQVARVLSQHFSNVYATDISAAQLQHAAQHANVHYRVGSAEESGLPDASVDLITVATALHWFDHPAFFAEAKRVLKPNGILACWCYYLVEIEPAVDALLLEFYRDITGPYWDPERRYVDERYASIDFPFEDLEAPELHIELQWTNANMEGFLNTWSSVQHMIRATGSSPVPEMLERVRAVWPDGEVKNVRFPLSMRAGRI